MRNELHHIEEIENYLEGRLSASDKAAFEKRMQADEGLREDVILQKQIANRIQHNAFKEQLAGFHELYMQPKPKKLIFKSFVLNSVIGIAFLGTAAASVYYLVNRIEEKKAPMVNRMDEPTAEISQPVNRIVTPVEVTDETKEQTKPTVSIVPVAGANRNEKETVPVLYNEQTLYQDFVPVFTSVDMDASVNDTIFMASSASVIYFPGGILIDANGKTVTGNVEIRYREYNNPAQTAFTGLPSTAQLNSGDVAVQSQGMFEVRAYKNGQELQLKPGSSFTIDYNVRKQTDDTYFMALDQKDNSWKSLKKVTYKKPQEVVFTRETTLNEVKAKERTGKILVKAYDAETGAVIETISARFEGQPTSWYTVKANVDSGYRSLMHEAGRHDLIIQARGYQKMVIKGVKIFDDKVSTAKVKLRPRNRYGVIQSKAEASYVLKDSVREIPTGRKRGFKRGDKSAGAWSQRTVRTKARGNVEGGLTCHVLGVYCCSATTGMQNATPVKTSYVTEDGRPVEFIDRICLVDKSLKNASVFTNGKVAYAKGKDQTLLVMTKEKKLYTVTNENLQNPKVDEEGVYTFRLKDITNNVKNWQELENFLEK